MTAFWAQVIAALVGALATGGVKLLGQHLQQRLGNRTTNQDRAVVVSVDDDD